MLAMQKAELLDQVPVMSATVLGLELLLSNRYVDLSVASEIVLSDVGATIQILRLIGKEYDAASDRPHRMGDCLASLDANEWFPAISARSFGCGKENVRLIEIWRHCRVVAQYAQLVAESLEQISPEDAYLVGLLHAAQAIPAGLGWSRAGSTTRDDEGVFAIEGTMPLFVLAALRSANDPTPSPWRSVLETAHELAGYELDSLAHDEPAGSTTDMTPNLKRVNGNIVSPDSSCLAYAAVSSAW